MSHSKVIKFNPESDNFIFVILNGNKVAYVKEEDIFQIDTTKKTYTFKLKEEAKKFEMQKS